MKNKHWWVSCIALILSSIAIVLVLFRVVPVHELNTESYIGVIVSLLGICVAFVLGYQIFNALEWKSELKKVKNLKDELISIKDNMTIMERRLESKICQADANGYRIEGEYIIAISLMLECLRHQIKFDDYASLNGTVGNIEVLIAFLKESDNENLWVSKHKLNKEQPEHVVKRKFDTVLTECKKQERFQPFEERLLAIKTDFDDLYEKHKDS
ncbi:MAG: hypothetical protein LBM63_05725 [Rikenellaceae bacterium]|jgi:hypothetical protein|nr:hypothetical protein [Rikenellaceae bacterium]